MWNTMDNKVEKFEGKEVIKQDDYNTWADSDSFQRLKKIVNKGITRTINYDRTDGDDGQLITWEKPMMGSVVQAIKSKGIPSWMRHWGD